ncbi:MAG: hypothetical protein HZA48_05165 [Planctomycetes bacterium]|nr:hypothetical protein [Planctomycetota bacterium]
MKKLTLLLCAVVILTVASCASKPYVRGKLDAEYERLRLENEKQLMVLREDLSKEFDAKFRTEIVSIREELSQVREAMANLQKLLAMESMSTGKEMDGIRQQVSSIQAMLNAIAEKQRVDGKE